MTEEAGLSEEAIIEALRLARLDAWESRRRHEYERFTRLIVDIYGGECL